MIAFLVFARKHIEGITLSSIAAASAILHLLPFLFYGAHPLGYDTGFYRRYLTEPFISFPNAPVPGLGDGALVPRVVLDTLRLLPLSADTILYGSYITLFAALPALLYVFIKPRLGVRGATIAAFLVTLSSVQYEFFKYMLWKNALALCLLMLAFIALERRWTLALLALDIGIALSHKTTAIIYILTLAVLFIVRSKDRPRIALHGFLTFACFAVVNTSFAHQIQLSSPVAVFLDWQEYIVFSIPFLVVIMSAIHGWRGFKIPLVFASFAFISFLFPLLRLPFYERIFIFSDIAIAVCAAYAIEYMFSQIDLSRLALRAYLYIGTLCIAGGLLLGTLWNQTATLRPLISEAEINHIVAISTIIPNDATILTTSDEAPWFEGWTQQHVAAPGMLRDVHNLEEWTALWNSTSSEAQIAFLGDLPQPLYISTFNGFENLIGEPADCLTRITPYLLHNTCSVEKK